MTLFSEHGLVVEGPPLFFETVTSSSSQISPSKQSASSNKEQRDIVGFAFAAPDLASMTHFRDNLRREVLRTKYPKDETLQQQSGESGKQESILRKSSFTNNALPQISVEHFIRVCCWSFYNLISLWSSDKSEVKYKWGSFHKLLPEHHRLGECGMLVNSSSLSHVLLSPLFSTPMTT